MIRFVAIASALFGLSFSAPLAAGEKQVADQAPAPPAMIEKGTASPKQSRAATPPPVESHLVFVTDNLLATLYHEMAHALVDALDLPIYGQEEDAADVLSAYMIHARHAERDARRIARNAATAFAYEADQMEQAGDTWDMWDDHGPDRQRYYNILCVFYGARPDARRDFANDMGLPEDRAERCEDEFALAERSWGAVLARLSAFPGATRIAFDSTTRNSLDEQVAAELSRVVEEMDTDYAIPGDLRVDFRLCGSRDRGYDAFYTSGRHKITICSEFARDLYRMSSGEM